ncbi:ABC transporter ATP-binding protein [Lachnospiraceae bacterium ZAX-1]
MGLVVLNDVHKVYQMGDVIITAADGIDFEIERGETAIILGPSGSGKTTVLNLLGGMDRLTSGKIIVEGNDIATYSRRELITYRRDAIGFVFQFYNLVQNLTAKENVELAAETGKDFIPAEEILAQVGLFERMDNFPTQLSGGEQQRVAIARALAKKPKLLLCDEPTGALDYATGKMVLKLLQDTCRKIGMTVVLVTHNSALAPMADRVIKLKNGKVSRIFVNPDPTPVEEIDW